MAREKIVRVTVDKDLAGPPMEPAFVKAEVLDARTLEITYDRDASSAGQVLALVQQHGYAIEDVTTREADLEDVFVQLTSSARAAASRAVADQRSAALVRLDHDRATAVRRNTRRARSAHDNWELLANVRALRRQCSAHRSAVAAKVRPEPMAVGLGRGDELGSLSLAACHVLRAGSATCERYRLVTLHRFACALGCEPTLAERDDRRARHPYGPINSSPSNAC